MVAFWQERLKNFRWKRSRWGKTGTLVVALVAALWLGYGGTWRAARGQESPLATPPPALAPVELPSISGVIRNDEGEPLTGLIVTAYRRQQQAWASARQTTTNGAGEYRFPWMPAGTYRLYVQDPQEVYASIYFPDVGDIEEAEDIIMTGAPLAQLDAVIEIGGQITGTLSWPDGPAPFNSTIELYRVTSAPISTRLSSSDNLDLAPELRQYRLVASKTFTETIAPYSFKGLAAGRYRVCAEAISLRSTLHECFDDVALGIHATDVVVTTGATVADVAIEFGDGADLATLAGMLTLADGTPAPGVDVEIVAAPNVDFFAAPPPQRTTTDGAGNFRAEELPYGNYLIRFSEPTGRYFATEYREPANVITPTVVALDRSDEVTITGVISAAAQITGHVTIDGAIAGMSGQIAAYQMTEQGWAAGGTGNIVAATGAYTVTGLRGGSYRLQVNAGLPGQIFYGGTTLETATEVEVMTATTTGGIDFDLTPYLAGVAYGSLSGSVLANGAAQPGMLVRVYEAGFDCCNAPLPLIMITTDAEGRFNAAGLPPGQYKIGVSAPDQPYATLYAPDQRTFETAMIYVIGDPVDGVARQVISDVNIAVGPVGSVARRILRPDDSPVVSATVNLYQRLGEPGSFPLVASTLTNDEGRYTFAGLVPDIYQVCIVVAGMAESSCSGRGGLGVGVDVAVSEGQETTGIDILNVP